MFLKSDLLVFEKDMLKCPKMIPDFYIFPCDHIHFKIYFGTTLLAVYKFILFPGELNIFSS